MKNNSNIKAVAFDYGGVIEINDGGHLMQAVADALGVSRSDLLKVYFKYNHFSNIENMPWEEMIIKVASEFTSSEEKKNKVRVAVREYGLKNKINTELLALLPILRRQGYKVAILSNATSALREKLNANGIAKLVDEIVISGEIGFQKPHEGAFRVLFERLGVQPNEVVFIDDTPNSLEKTSEIGCIPILFKNNEQLKLDLEKLGISVN